MRPLYTELDTRRVFDEQIDKEIEPYRAPWRRDYARLIHSPCFRRLQGKTQVFPGQESDFYRNRLTHSLEVAQIAKAIAIRLNATEAAFKRRSLKIEPDIVEFAGLAHDLGHPPFGHNGEEALDECMSEHGGFEGNAQSLRIVSRLEKKIIAAPNTDVASSFSRYADDLRRGLNLSFRSLASILKYDAVIPERAGDRRAPGVQKGYYNDDEYLVAAIKTNVLGVDDFSGRFKTIECSIMDIADDISYSTYDLEDNFKAGFLSPMGLFALDDEIYQAVAYTIKSRMRTQYPERKSEADSFDADDVQFVLFSTFREMLFGEDKPALPPVQLDAMEKSFIAAEVQALSKNLSVDGYHRTKFTSRLVQHFLTDLEVVRHKIYPQLHAVRLSFDAFIYMEVLKNITYHAIIRSSFLQVVEHRGKDIVKSIFQVLQSEDGTRLLPADFQTLCRKSNEIQRMRAICDFIAGMTDRYAFEFYDRLFGSARLTIHKPL